MGPPRPRCRSARASAHRDRPMNRASLARLPTCDSSATRTATRTQKRTSPRASLVPPRGLIALAARAALAPPERVESETPLITAGCCKILTTRKHGEGAGRGICGSPGLGAAAGERSAGDACRGRAECVCVGACASVRLSVRACGEGSERASRSGPRPDREAAGRTGRSVHALLLPRPRARTA